MTKKTTRAEREATLQEIEASNLLEGYAPLTSKDGVPYKLQNQWLAGEITEKENTKKLKEYYGLDVGKIQSQIVFAVLFGPLLLGLSACFLYLG